MRTILISAYACEPLKGSEQGVGWNWVLQMAKHNYVHVITRVNNQEPIEAHLPKELAKNITFHYYDTNNFIRGFKNKAKGLFIYYFFWQLGIIPLITKLLKKKTIDYTMHLTMGSVWMPTFLPLFKKPFIWGPIGGGDGEPNTFIKVLPFKQKVLQLLRIILNKTVVINPFILFTAYRAVAILCRTEHTSRLFPKRLKPKIKVVLETAMEQEVFSNVIREKNRNKNGVRLITTGRLMPSKNIITAIKSVALLPADKKVSLTIIGSGKEKNNLKAEIDRLKLNNIEIVSEIERENVLEALTQSDIYLFPSLREGGSWALMEAMAIGLPVICLKWAGMEIITDKNSAIQLAVTNPEQMPKDMANAICKLIDNPDLMLKMGNAGRERIKRVFNWDAKGLFMENLLNDLETLKTTNDK